MDRKQTDEATRRVVGRLQKLLGLEAWTIEHVIGRCGSDEAVAEISVQDPYRRADLTVDHKKIDNLPALLQTLVHELLHVSLSRLDGAVSNAILCCDSGAKPLMEAVFTDAIEHAVVGLEDVVVAAYKARWKGI